MPSKPGFAALRDVLQTNGVPFQTQDVDVTDVAEVVDALALPADVVALYTKRGPAPLSSLPWVVEDLLLFAIQELLTAQEGYRWEGPQRTVSPRWSPDWVVIASIFGDPFLIDLSEAGPPVYFARHGAGTWKPERVAPTVNGFIACLTAFETVLLGDFGLDVWDEAGLRPDFISATRRAVERTVPTADAEHFVAALD